MRLTWDRYLPIEGIESLAFADVLVAHPADDLPEISNPEQLFDAVTVMAGLNGPAGSESGISWEIWGNNEADWLATDQYFPRLYLQVSVDGAVQAPHFTTAFLMSVGAVLTRVGEPQVKEMLLQLPPGGCDGGLHHAIRCLSWWQGAPRGRQLNRVSMSVDGMDVDAGIVTTAASRFKNLLFGQELGARAGADGTSLEFEAQVDARFNVLAPVVNLWCQCLGEAGHSGAIRVNVTIESP